MAGAHSQYTQELRSQLGNYRATWLPLVRLVLGTVGTLEDGIFVPRSHLNSFGITFKPNKAPQADAQFQFQSNDGVSLTFTAEGSTNQAFQHIAQGEAGIGIDFTRANAVVFSLGGCTEDRIDDQFGLGGQLLSLPQANFPQNYIIVTHLITATSGTILVSSSGNSRMEIRANAELGGLADLARADVGLAIAYANDMQTQIVASAGLTPLFRAVRIRKHWFSGRQVESLGPRDIPLDEVVEEVN